MPFRFTDGELRVFARRPHVPLSEWAARNLIVRDGPHAGGRYRRDVNPYLTGIMDAWSAPGVEEVVVCGSAQTGKTLVMHAAICYAVARRPGPRMLAMQDDDALGKVAQLKLLPMFRSSPGVRGMLGKVRAQRIGFRDGTSLFLASAQSPGQRASLSVQDLFLDEEALYRQIAGQGVPVAEFKERTRSYAHKRKILRVSKPIGGEECSIVQALADVEELRHYLVRCPACQAYQPMIEDRLVLLEKGAAPRDIRERRLGRYRCAECGYLWTDHLRDQAVSHGHWEAEEPVAHPRSVGFLLPAILSANVSISEIVADKVAAEQSDSPAVKQQYVNGLWAAPFRMVELESREEEILALVDPDLPPRTVPGDAVALTAGIDVQARGFWYVVKAWRPDMSSALIDYGRLTDWPAVQALLDGRYPFETSSPRAGQSLHIWRAGIDSGGTRLDDAVVSRTEEVYTFVRRHGQGRLFACKGLSRESHTPVRATMIDRLPSSRMRIPGGLWLYLLDTHYFKGLVFGRLRMDAHQPMTLHSKTDESFARQITAEVLERERGGQLVWRRLRKANHFLDCVMMADACVDGSWLPSFQRIVEQGAQARQAAPSSAGTPPPAPSATDPRRAAVGDAVPRRGLPGPRPLPDRAPPITRRPSIRRGHDSY